ncbi:hypothetical protein VS868_01300 [Salinimicrobium sp. 3283s]|uniref:hypothetical protein n=1 Tax=Salinimicrobium sp. 3283s TaxID=3114359 RepID=UPI0031E64E3A
MKIFTTTPLFFLALATLLLNTGFIQAQEQLPEQRDYKVRPIRLGVKIGFPNMVGGNVEYVTPLLNDKVSVILDYSTIESDWFLSEDESGDTETTDLSYSYIEGGINYYIFKAGKGLYAGVSYGQMKFEGQTDVNEDGMDGTGYIDYDHSSFNIKLGAKLGGLFYFRPEIGYAFSSLPKTIDYQVRYPDGTTERDIYDFEEELASADILFKGLIANIGFGFSF